MTSRLGTDLTVVDLSCTDEAYMRSKVAISRGPISGACRH